MRAVSLQTYNRLVDAIYSANTDLEQWTKFLELLSNSFDGIWTSMHCADSESRIGFAITGSMFDPDFVDSLRSEYAHVNPWSARAALAPVGQAQTSEWLLPRADLMRSRFYNEWLQPQEDIGTGAGITLARTPTRLLRLSCNIRFKDQERVQSELVTVLDLLSPHLMRGFAVTRHLRGGVASFDALNLLPTAVFLLGPEGKVVFANEAADRLRRKHPVVDYSRDGRILFADPAAQRAVDRTLHAVATQARSDLADLPPIRVSTPDRTFSAAVAPLGEAPETLETLETWLTVQRPVAVLTLTPIASPTTADIPNLSTKFKFTNAESNLIAGLYDGMSLKEYATHRAISYHTARKQLQAVYAKTGLSRQSQLISLMAGWR